TIDPDGTETINATYNSLDLNEKNSSIQLIVDEGGNWSIEQTQDLTLGGGGASLSWFPVSANFGGTDAGVPTSTISFTLSNTGDDAATGCSAPVLVGSEAGSFVIQTDHCSTNDLNAGASCSVVVY